MEGISDTMSPKSFPPIFPSCDLELVVCFVFLAILINHTVSAAYFPVGCGLKVKVHFAPSSPWASERQLAPRNFSAPPSFSIFEVVSTYQQEF